MSCRATTNPRQNWAIHVWSEQREVQISSFSITCSDLFPEKINLTQPGKDRFKANHNAPSYAECALAVGTVTFSGISFGT